MGHNGIWHKGNGSGATRKTPPSTSNISSPYRPNLYDHSRRVPAIVRWPGVVKPGAVVSATCSSFDWYPTIAAMGGVELSPGEAVRGRNVLPWLKGETVAGWDNDFYAEYGMRIYCRTDLRAYRTPQWKLVRDFLNPERDELYDLVRDPEETTNRIADRQPRVRDAIRLLDAKIRERMQALRDRLLETLPR